MIVHNYLLHDLHVVCEWIVAAVVLSLILPRDRRFARWPRFRYAYSIFRDCVLVMALKYPFCLRRFK